MFETSLSMAVTKWGNKTCEKLDPDYFNVWQTLKKNFNPNWTPASEEWRHVFFIWLRSISVIQYGLRSETSLFWLGHDQGLLSFFLSRFIFLIQGKLLSKYWFKTIRRCRMCVEAWLLKSFYNHNARLVKFVVPGRQFYCVHSVILRRLLILWLWPGERILSDARLLTNSFCFWALNSCMDVSIPECCWCCL